MAVAAWPAMPRQKLLMLLDKLSRLAVPEEEPADRLSGPGGDRHSEIAPHRQMSFGRAVKGIVLSVTRVFADVIGADDARPLQGRLEHGRFSRHRKLVELLSRHARKGIKHVALALVVDDVVKERAEFSAHELGAGVSRNLYDLVHIKLGGQSGARAVQHIELAGFGADRLLRLVLLGDVVTLDEDPGRRRRYRPRSAGR